MAAQSVEPNGHFTGVSPGRAFRKDFGDQRCEPRVPGSRRVGTSGHHEAQRRLRQVVAAHPDHVHSILETKTMGTRDRQGPCGARLRRT